MSEDRTKEINDPRSFEERVFARFDTVDQRFDRMEIRITSLEDERYDTKPIWERALAEIAELNRAIQEFRAEFQTGLEGLRTDLRSEFQTGFQSVRNDVRAELETGFERVRTEIRAVFTDLRHESITSSDTSA